MNETEYKSYDLFYDCKLTLHGINLPNPIYVFVFVYSKPLLILNCTHFLHVIEQHEDVYTFFGKLGLKWVIHKWLLFLLFLEKLKNRKKHSADSNEAFT